MKKLISLILALALCMTAFAAFAETVANVRKNIKDLQTATEHVIEHVREEIGVFEIGE